MTEREFTELLIRFEKGECTREERELLDKWLNSPGRGRAPFINEADKMKVKNALRESVFRKTGLRSFLNARRAVLSGRGSRVGRLGAAYRIAASIIFIAVVGYGTFRYYEKIRVDKYAVTEMRSDKDILKVHLSDGSIVWLKPQSSLIYPNHFGSEGDRIVTLRGEALFEVERITAQPFVVRAGELTATVLGTSFNINATGEQVEVVVLTGKVSLTSTTDREGVVVMPDEKAIYNGESKHLAKADTPIEKPVAEAIVAGTEYNMSFNGTRMSEVIRRIEGKFNAKVDLSNADLGNCIITADFTDQPLVKTMDIIAKTLAAEYEISGRTITLSGEGCN